MSKYIKKFSSDFIDLSQEDIPILEVLIIELSLGSCTGIKENLSNMLFIPKGARQMVYDLSYTFHIEESDYKEIFKWIGLNILLSTIVAKWNFEKKLCQKKLVRRADLRKCDRLFRGWAKPHPMFKEMVKKVSEVVSGGRERYLAQKHFELRKKIDDMKVSLEKRFDGRRVLWFEVNRIRIRASDDEWWRCKQLNWRKMKNIIWENGSGTSSLFYGRESQMSAKSDDYLRQKFGELEVEPLVYGGVELSDNERSAISLPPKFALLEEVSVKDLRLEVRKTGVKMRWNMRNENESVGLEQDVFDSTAFLKGGREVDFSKTRVTDFKGCKRVCVPKPVQGGSFEARWRSVEVRLEEAARGIRDSLKHRFGEKAFYNVDDQIESGLLSLKERRESDNVVFFQSDKSGKMSVDTKENFSEKMQVHLECGEQIDIDSVVKTEKILNARAKVWTRILSMGVTWNQVDRVEQAVSTSSSMPPPVYGQPKDHKTVDDGQDHPLRPVCGANVGPGANISNLLSSIITPFCDEFSTDNLVESTEDLQSRICGVNDLSLQEREGLCVLSMDATALFPSLSIGKSGEAVKQLIQESSIAIKNVNVCELGRYLAYLYTEAELTALGIGDFVMKRRATMGRKPCVTGDELSNPWVEEKSIWMKAKKIPDRDCLRFMLSLAVSKDVVNCHKQRSTLLSQAAKHAVTRYLP